MFSSLSAVTRGEGFPTRDELIALYEERSGRSMSDLRWYQTLALWKAAVFMEGNYKRSLAGTTDDPFLKLFDEGVPRPVSPAYADVSLAIQKAFHPPDGLDPGAVVKDLQDKLDKAAEGKIF